MTALPLDPEDMARLEAAGEWCVRVADDSMDATERAAFADWLEQDPRNRAAFDDTVRTWRLMHDASFEPKVIDHRRAALDLYRRKNASRWRLSSQRSWAGRLAMAAAALVIVISLGFAWTSLPKQYQTGVGERHVVMLADGSKISLDASTNVAVRYSGGKRQLWLKRGRAKFDVAHDKTRPFTVAAADKIILATGTQFSVEEVGAAVHVILYEGRVSVFEKPDRSQSTPRPLVVTSTATPAAKALTPGKELVAAINAPQVQLVTTDAGKSLSWEAGQLVLIDEPLERAVERVNRYSTQKVEVADARVGSMAVNGVYTAGDTQAFVEGVTGVLQLRAEQSGDRIVLFAR